HAVVEGLLGDEAVGGSGRVLLAHARQCLRWPVPVGTARGPQEGCPPPQGLIVGPRTPASSKACLARSRISRGMANCSPGRVLAKIRSVIVPPETDSTPATVGVSRSRSAQAGSSAV